MKKNNYIGIKQVKHRSVDMIKVRAHFEELLKALAEEANWSRLLGREIFSANYHKKYRECNTEVAFDYLDKALLCDKLHKHLGKVVELLIQEEANSAEELAAKELEKAEERFLLAKKCVKN